ncbi:MAG: TIR domain-containing protein [Pseudomonadota bacterium]
MPSIFLSYRREDTAGHAGRLFDRLRTHFGAEDVFWDVSGSIAPGENFVEAIDRAVGRCDALLAMIGRNWVTIKNPDGTRRLTDPHDFVRLEIAKALERNIRVIPVLVHGATMPSPEDLPDDLKNLSRRQGIEITDRRWDYDVKELIDSLDRGGSGRSRHRLWALGAVAVAALGLVGWLGSDWIESTIGQQRLPPSETVAERPSPPVQPRPKPPSSERVAMPELRGLSLDVARTRLADLGLKVGELEFFTLGKYAPGQVYNQKSRAGAMIRAGSAVALLVEREKLPGIHASGQFFLTPNQVMDLDNAPAGGREAHDIRFEGRDPQNRLIQPKNGAAFAVAGRQPVDQGQCEAKTYSTADIKAQAGQYICVRTNRNRYASLRIDAVSEELKISFDTWSGDRTPSAEVTLFDGDSYHFKSGERSRLTGGDFYVGIDENGGAMFWANNRDQRGLVDLGNIGGIPLSEVSIPGDGYRKHDIPAIEGNTYVSLAKAGEEGQHIVFRVMSQTDQSLVLSFVYR